MIPMGIIWEEWVATRYYIDTTKVAMGIARYHGYYEVS